MKHIPHQILKSRLKNPILIISHILIYLALGFTLKFLEGGFGGLQGLGLIFAFMLFGVLHYCEAINDWLQMHGKEIEQREEQIVKNVVQYIRLVSSNGVSHE